MTVQAEGTHRAVISGYTFGGYLAMLEQYAVNTGDSELTEKIPKLRRSLDAVSAATCNTHSLPEANGFTTHYMTVEIFNFNGEICALYYHSNSSGQLDLLTNTGQYMETLIPR